MHKRTPLNTLLGALSAGTIFISILACGGGDDTPDPDPGTPTSSFEFCGGIAGIQCSNAAEICVQDQGMCIVADSSGSCQIVPDACPKNLAPVCGCDGVTYDNACLANLAGAAVDHDGTCGAPVGSGDTCGTRGAPACGGKEVCIWQEGANCGRADAPGACQVTPSICPANYDPVCGCDGLTYTNTCDANSAGVSVDYSGKCKTTNQPTQCGARLGNTCDPSEFCSFVPNTSCDFADATGTCEGRPQVCPANYDPVCGCDGQTYSNACNANAAGTSVQLFGACPQN